MHPSGQPSAAADPWTGRVVGGRWRILSLLDDSGGMASVYLADDTRLPRKAVVKIPKAAQSNAEFAERFAREAHHHATVENVHVVNILDRGEEAGTPYLVLQYLPGGNLKAWCAKNPSILTDPRRHVEAWLLPVAQALDAVAAKGIVHRDVKPTNILRIDGIAPRVAKVTPPAGKGERTTGDRLVFRVEFDEAVAVEGKPVLSFRAGGRSRQAEFTAADDKTLEFSVTVAADDESDDGVTATALVLGGGAIRDAVGNAADAAFSPRKSAAFAINARPAPPVVPPKPEPVPAGPRPGTVETNSIGMQLVVIPAGRFEMGGAETKATLRADGFTFVDYEAFDCTDEGPVHPVRITKPFLMGVHEVTLGEFLKFYHDGYAGKLDCETDGKGGWGYTGEQGNELTQRADFVPWSWGHPTQTNAHPVVNVSWNDCVAFCEWLSRKEGKRYRLPTEAEWEYACRAGTGNRFWNGGDPDGVTAVDNVADATAKEKFPWWEGASRRDGHAFTAPVGSFQANPFKLHDMHGNVAEWCSDWYDKAAYARSPAADPQGPDAGSFRVIRGGSWNRYPVYCRSANRIQRRPDELLRQRRFSGGA